MLVSVGGGLLAGVVFTLALNRILAAWAEGSSRDPIILLAADAELVGPLGNRVRHHAVKSHRG
jgi:hypothetical protein